MYERIVYQTLEMVQDACHSVSKIELRDLFAMSALQGILPTLYGQNAENANVASSAYALADAMLEARRRK